MTWTNLYRTTHYPACSESLVEWRKGSLRELHWGVLSLTFLVLLTDTASRANWKLLSHSCSVTVSQVVSGEGGKVQAATLEPHLSWLGLNFVILESVDQELIHNFLWFFLNYKIAPEAQFLLFCWAWTPSLLSSFFSEWGKVSFKCSPALFWFTPGSFMQSVFYLSLIPNNQTTTKLFIKLRCQILSDLGKP